MNWHVQYRKGMADHVARFATPERAIEAACRLIAGGTQVFGIGTGPLEDSIATDRIARIYAIWAAERTTFGRRTN